MSRQEETKEEDEDRQRPLSFLHLMSLFILPLNYNNNKPSNPLTQCTTNGNGTKLLLQSSWSGVDIS